MPRLSLEERFRVVTLFRIRYKILAVHRRLREEKIKISLPALYKFAAKYRDKGVIVDLPRRKRQRLITEEMKKMIEEEMRKNDELTSFDIKSMLEGKWRDLTVSISTVKRVRKEMGWVCTRPHYCQLLRDVSNKCYYS